MAVKKYAGIILFDKSNKTVFLQRRSIVVKNPEMWSFTGGKVEKGETYLEAAIREFKEEVGVSIKNPEVLKLFFYLRKKNSRVAIYYGYVSDPDKFKKAVKLNELEASAVAFLTWNDIERYRKRGFISDRDYPIFLKMKTEGYVA